MPSCSSAHLPGQLCGCAGRPRCRHALPEHNRLDTEELLVGSRVVVLVRGKTGRGSLPGSLHRGAQIGASTGREGPVGRECWELGPGDGGGGGGDRTGLPAH